MTKRENGQQLPVSARADGLGFIRNWVGEAAGFPGVPAPSRLLSVTVHHRQICSADLSVGLAISFFSSSLMGKLRFRPFGGTGCWNHLL